ncbi:MAG: hypothetical protein L6Q97_21500 [Thermoanaerobaculia bacterium]|nr:hypothetical protein [Thermoanaerobaculia bacterium]
MKLIIPFLLLSLFATAQTGSDYKIEKRDSLGYILLQNGRTVPFDTAQVQTNLAQKTEEVGVIETEIGLLERLVMLRRQLAVAREEKRTLNDILEKARQCTEVTPSKN